MNPASCPSDRLPNPAADFLLPFIHIFKTVRKPAFFPIDAQLPNKSNTYSLFLTKTLQILQEFFPKTVDKRRRICYTEDGRREKELQFYDISQRNIPKRIQNAIYAACGKTEQQTRIIT